MKVNKRNAIIMTTLITLCSTITCAKPTPSSLPANVFKSMYNCGEIDIQEQINIDELLEKDLSIKGDTSEPQILIIHSHPQESYTRDKKGDIGSVIDVGNELERILEKNYKVSVVHLDRADSGDLIGAYERIESKTQKILKQYPSIEVIIDIHRDGGQEPTATLVNKKPMAKININNGICIDENKGTIGSLKGYSNPYIQDNLSFSTQIKYTCDTIAPNLIDNIILYKYRYSLHMVPKSLMINVGNNMDTSEAAKNAIEPFSEVLASVLKFKAIDK